MRFNNALKVQGTLARGNALGCSALYSVPPCKGRINAAFTLPLQGVTMFWVPCTQPAGLG